MAGRWTIARLNAETAPITEVERHILAAVDPCIVEAEGASDDEVRSAARDCDALMVVSAHVRGSVIEQLTRCRIISRLGTGVDKIDVEAATRRGIFVTNLPDFCTNEVADHTMALLLAAARQLKLFEAGARQGKVPRDVRHMRRLATCTLSLIGFGRIGRAVAVRARAFGMRVLACDPALTAEAAAETGVSVVDLPTALAEADYLSLLCPLTPATRHMLTLEQFRQMKPTAVLINTGRGELVDEDDLVTALREGIIRYAAIDVYGIVDVFAPQGFPTGHPLFSLPNVLLTPHVSAFSEEALAEQRRGGAEAVVQVLSGQWPRHPVNPDVKPWFVLTQEECP
ncbi:MAG TPA: C-terminal binding protein [Armatimonadota bacterium]|nr:C-terminal binding protein [Armatimonadota bacterium]HQK95523.1 C-terminal binding protein [Armatimonadota bacterium]